MSLPENETTVNLKSASFVVIMLSPEGLTHINSQKKPRMRFGESFALIEQIGLFNVLLFLFPNFTWPLWLADLRSVNIPRVCFSQPDGYADWTSYFTSN